MAFSDSLVYYSFFSFNKIGCYSSIMKCYSISYVMQCVTIDDAEWENQLQKHSLKVPSSISLLSAKDCQELGIGGVSFMPFTLLIFKLIAFGSIILLFCV